MRVLQADNVAGCSGGHWQGKPAQKAAFVPALTGGFWRAAATFGSGATDAHGPQVTTETDGRLANSLRTPGIESTGRGAQ